MLKLGTKGVAAIYRGSTPVSRIYQGSRLLFSGGGGGSFLRDWTVFGKSEVVGSQVLGVGDEYGWAQVVTGVNAPNTTVYGITRSAVEGDPYAVRYTGTSTYATNFTATQAFALKAGHIYCIVLVGMPSGGGCRINTSSVAGANASIFSSSSAISYNFGVIIEVGTTVDAILRPMAFDLTAIFGSGNEPSTVDEFKAWLVKVGKMAKVTDDIPYFPYDAGSTFTSLPIVASSRNLWDEVWETGALATTPAGATFDQLKTVDAGCYRTKNLIPVEGGSILYITSPISANIRILCFNENGEFTYSTLKYNSTFTIPSNTAYIAFYQRNNGGVYPGGICINISDDLDGTYTPHQSQRFPLVISSPLHGIGDVRDIMRYSLHGITRKYVAIDMGTLSWRKYVEGRYFLCSNMGYTSAATSTSLSNKCLAAGYTAFNLWTRIDSEYNDMTIGVYQNQLRIADSTKSSMTEAQFAASLSGVYVIVELETPTFEPVTLPKLPAYRDGTVLYTDTQVHGDTIAGEAPVGFSLLPPDGIDDQGNVSMTESLGEEEEDI